MFFFMQKTAYELRISDWSSDVCSSDLAVVPGTAIVAGEDDERIVVDAGALELGHHVADAAVKLRDHRAIDARFLVLDLRQLCIILLRRLERRVRRVEGKEIGRAHV